MNKDAFEKRREKLIHFAEECLAKNKIDDKDKIALVRLLDILKQYTFESRLQVKGLLSHTIIDSIEVDHNISNEFMNFDKMIT